MLNPRAGHNWQELAVGGPACTTMKPGLEGQLVAGASGLLPLETLVVEVGMAPGLTNKHPLSYSWALRTALRRSLCWGSLTCSVIQWALLTLSSGLNFDLGLW